MMAVLYRPGSRFRRSTCWFVEGRQMTKSWIARHERRGRCELEGRTAFITGGASGIGLGMARAFLGTGMNVIVTDLRAIGGDEAREAMAPELISDWSVARSTGTHEQQSLPVSASPAMRVGWIVAIPRRRGRGRDGGSTRVWIRRIRGNDEGNAVGEIP